MAVVCVFKWNLPPRFHGFVLLLDAIVCHFSNLSLGLERRELRYHSWLFPDVVETENLAVIWFPTTKYG